MNMFKSSNSTATSNLTNAQISSLIERGKVNNSIAPRIADEILSTLKKDENKTKKYNELKNLRTKSDGSIDEILRRTAGVPPGTTTFTDEAKYKELADKVDKSK